MKKESSVNELSNNKYPPLDQVTREVLTTDEAAFYLNRRPQTLRAWACLTSGPCMPVRIMGRLAWKVTDIKSLLELGA